MAYFEWSDHLKINNEEIDRQHQGLVALLDKMYVALSQGKGNKVIGGILVDLSLYTKTHFAAEEKMMKIHGYPKYEVHKKEHEDLTKEVVDLFNKYNTGEPVSAIVVGEFLKDWLKNHIKKTDMQFGSFLNSKGVR